MFPLLVKIGELRIATYGVLVAIGYLVGILWLRTQVRDMPKMNEDKFWTLIYSLFFGAVAGGKLLFVLVEWDAYASGELSLISDFRYGFVFFGGLLGSMVTGAVATRRLKLPYLGTADYFGVALPMGHAIGRLGCLAAGCCYGAPTSLPWGIAMGGHPASSTPEELWGVPLHPVAVYESAADAAIFLWLMLKVLPRVKAGRLPPGTVFFGYVLLYSAARFVIEFFRADDRGFTLFGLSPSQGIALVCAAASVAGLARLGALAPRRRAA